LAELLNVIKYSTERTVGAIYLSLQALRYRSAQASRSNLIIKNKKIINKLILKNIKTFLPIQVEFRWENFEFLEFKKT